MEIIGFLFLCVLNLYFTVIVLINLAAGGGDLGPLLTGWVNWKYKVLGILLIVLCAYFWILIVTHSPFIIGIK